MSKGTLSPSVHEAVIQRHMKDDEDDAILQALLSGVKACREAATKAHNTSEVVLLDETQTVAARHKKARNAGFTLLESATRNLDGAVKAAQGEVEKIAAKLKGPGQSKDLIVETRQRELRERLAMLDETRRKQIINEAITANDDLLVGAVLSSPAWLSGLSETEIAVTRSNWAKKHHASDVDRLERLQKAIGDSQHAGERALHFVDALTDSELVKKADASAQRAAQALQAVK